MNCPPKTSSEIEIEEGKGVMPYLREKQDLGDLTIAWSLVFLM